MSCDAAGLRDFTALGENLAVQGRGGKATTGIEPV
jgi:hypothetical protein